MPRYFALPFVLLLAASAVASEAPNVTSPGAVRVAIDARNAEWMAAFRRGDTKAVAALYDDDATVIPGGAEPIRGRGAIESLFRNAQTTLKDVRLETTNLTIVGDYAYETGKSHQVIASPEGKMSAATDDYVVIWKRGKDGQWSYHVDLWWPAK
jgi:uncharacterized protein (TIGR02246 family)